MSPKGAGEIISFEKTCGSPWRRRGFSLILLCLRWSWLLTLFVRETFSTGRSLWDGGASESLRLPTAPQMSAHRKEN